MNRTDLFDNLLQDFSTLHQAMGVKHTHHSKAPSITGAQWRGLFLLEKKQSCAVKEIATTLGITSSAATQMLDGLVTGGYALRSATSTDRRVVVVTISGKGKKMVTEMRKCLHESIHSLFSRFTDAELKQYCMLTSKLVSKS